MRLDWNVHHHLKIPEVETAKSHTNKSYSDFTLFKSRENRVREKGGKTFLYAKFALWLFKNWSPTS